MSILKRWIPGLSRKKIRGDSSRPFPDGAVLDEIQRVPDLPSYLQEIVDNDPLPGKYILTGSQQFELMNQVSQSLAGTHRLVAALAALHQ